MSTAQHPDAQVKGYNGPYFPESVRELRRAIDGLKEFTAQWMDAVIPQIPGYRGKEHMPTTSDGYKWFWSLLFSRDGGEVLILLPWSGDASRAGGTRADRSIAVHVRGCNQKSADKVVKAVARAIADAPSEPW